MSNKICIVTKFWNESQLLPYFLKQFDNLPVDIHFYDGGSTDDSIDIAINYMKTHPLTTSLSILEHIHDDYLHECDNSEVVQLNQMRIDNLNYEWVIHIDVDEVLIDINKLIGSLLTGYFNGWDLIRVHRYNCKTNVDTYIVSYPNMPWDISKDYQARIYNPKNVYYYKAHGQDAVCITPDPNKTVYAEVQMLHLKDAMINRRNNRGQPLGNISKRFENAITAKVPFIIPSYVYDIDIDSII